MEQAKSRQIWTAGDRPAFDQLVHEHAAAIFGFVVRRTGDRALSEDLSQETFLRAWRGRASYRGESSVRGWLLAIAANAVRDHERMRRRRVMETTEEAAAAVPAAGADPSLRAEHAEAIERLHAALAVLPEAHREMFLLRERDGLSYRDIAAVLGCPVGSVMSGLSRARERLLAAVEG